MNKIWLYLVLLSTSALLFIRPEAAIDSMLSASKTGILLCIDFCAIYAVWMGIMEIVEETGLSEKLGKKLSPLVRKLFKINNKEAEKYITMNLSSNLLGLGNAATPYGIKAIKALDDKSGKITFPMTMLLVINATSLQLLPTTAIGMRLNGGSTASSDIILPCLITTIITTLTGVLLTLLIEKIKNKRKKSS
ncbi:MAG: hypothetical protein RR400_00705 [Clostridia bacterium]